MAQLRKEAAQQARVWRYVFGGLSVLLAAPYAYFLRSWLMFGPTEAHQFALQDSSQLPLTAWYLLNAVLFSLAGCLLLRTRQAAPEEAARKDQQVLLALTVGAALLWLVAAERELSAYWWVRGGFVPFSLVLLYVLRELSSDGVREQLVELETLKYEHKRL